MPSLVGKIVPGDVLGRCRVVRELGRGGMGTVYLARHETLQIDVALKVLSPTISLDHPHLAERFVREAQLAARIRHPNVIAVMDAAQENGLYFIVQEYVGGGSVNWHLRHGPMPEAKALTILTGITHALIVAEENSIVHRDIKPDNILLDLRGTAKLADLGLAKHAIDARTSLTLGGSFIGTPAYMSPEQARDAKSTDTRDDIYSLGATFYECLTGSPPFQGETPYNIMSELLTKPSPSARAAQPTVSRAADLICRKMMAKRRELRYPNAQALLEDLQICQTLGDAGLPKLLAARFEDESLQARNYAASLGIETSADGVAMLDDDDLPPRRRTLPVPRTPAIARPRRADRGVFGAAALLLIFVTAACLFLVWWGPGHLPFFSSQQEKKPAPRAVASTTVVVAPASNLHPAETQPLIAPAPKASPPELNPTAAIPVVYPVTNTMVNPPALPLETSGPFVGPPIPLSLIPPSAFVARTAAEASLKAETGQNNPTGQSELLRIVGKRAPYSETPQDWTYYFFDKSASRNARIISVREGKAIKNSDSLLDIDDPSHLVPVLSSYREQDVIPDEKLLIDSTQALEIARGLLIPGVVVSSAQYSLSAPKNLGPRWQITLWAKDDQGEERQLGTVILSAETGTVLDSKLKQQNLAPNHNQ